MAKGSNLHDLPEYAVIQINDTHPTMVIPELIRLLVQRGLDMDDAIDVVSRTCAYTNHTILAEALEKWPVILSEESRSAADADHPRCWMTSVRRDYHDERVLYHRSRWHRVHMAHIDIHFGYRSKRCGSSAHTDSGRILN
ncbi:MAG: glycogen/starch/alpha-glucan phosphorylase [Faecalimonas sp.]